MHAAPTDPLLQWYTKANYLGWNLLARGDTALASDVVAQNVLYLLGSPAAFWSLPNLPAMRLLYLIASASVVAGTFSLLRGAGAAGALWAAATVGIALIWTWPPLRFLVPVMPFLILGLVSPLPLRRIGVGRTVARCLLAVLILFGATESVRLAAATVRRHAPASYTARSGASTAELMGGMQWVAAHTQPDAVVAATLDANYWLYAGRKAVRAFAADPVGMFYSADAPFGSLGDARALYELLVMHRVDYLVFEDIPVFTETEPLRRQIAEVVAAWPGVLQEVWRSSDGRVVVFWTVL
jgi:hypothetical protein